MCLCMSHRAFRVYIRSFQSNGDAVEEDENENYVVEYFVGDHPLAPQTESKHMAPHMIKLF